MLYKCALAKEGIKTETINATPIPISWGMQKTRAQEMKKKKRVTWASTA
jgi:hypothetical protein